MPEDPASPTQLNALLSELTDHLAAAIWPHRALSAVHIEHAQDVHAFLKHTGRKLPEITLGELRDLAVTLRKKHERLPQ
jgi:hypothetical protein